MKSTVVFFDHTSERHQVFSYQGACVVGQPTAYVYRNGKLVWVVRLNDTIWHETY